MKSVPTLQWERLVSRLGTAPERREKLDAAAEWLLSDQHYGPARVFAQHELPNCRFAPSDMAAFLAVDKAEAHVGPIRGYVKGFLVPQPAKRRRRPVFEPIANDTCARACLPAIKYPSRRERRTMQAGCKLTSDYDFSVCSNRVVRRRGVRARKRGIPELSR